MTAVWLVPIVLQGAAMTVDELVCHRRRGLDRWERIGHPLDTLTLAVCLAWLLWMPATARGALPVYVCLAIASTLFVTKDEAVHARACAAGEHWLHAVLFALHPIVLAAFAMLWRAGATGALALELGLVLAFGVYQIAFWHWPARHIDNAWYADLGARWYEARDTPIALLRAEARHRNPWLAAALGPAPRRVLDLGCGGGLLANELAARGHRVAGIDQLAENLAVARARDGTGAVAYHQGDACALPFPDASFDAVFAMDLLEHVDAPDRVIAEAARVLRPGGQLFFHTFNRTWLARVIVIAGVELFVRNTPKGLHVHHMFRTPAEVTAMCRRAGLTEVRLVGSRPRFGWPLWRMVLTGDVGDDFAFTFTRSLRLGYTGVARKGDA